MGPEQESANFDPPVGAVVHVAPGVRRILAPNPSAMTFRGTNTYVVGQGEVAVIDPGPQDERHLAALRRALAGERVRHILVTHAHLDHSSLAARLAAETGAPVLAFGDATAGRAPQMVRLAEQGLTGGGEGVDHGFCPDARLRDGAQVRVTLDGQARPVTALHTPGHMAGHLCFAFGNVLFSGDLVMGWSTSLVSPPDGDLAAFLASCASVRARRAAALLPGHGGPVVDPAARIDALIAHRHRRSAQILACLSRAPQGVATLTAEIYADTNPALHPAAARNIFAHLIDLETKCQITATPNLAFDAVFQRTDDF